MPRVAFGNRLDPLEWLTLVDRQPPGACVSVHLKVVVVCTLALAGFWLNTGVDGDLTPRREPLRVWWFSDDSRRMGGDRLYLGFSGDEVPSDIWVSDEAGRLVASARGSLFANHLIPCRSGPAVWVRLPFRDPTAAFDPTEWPRAYKAIAVFRGGTRAVEFIGPCDGIVVGP